MAIDNKITAGKHWLDLCLLGRLESSRYDSVSKTRRDRETIAPAQRGERRKGYPTRWLQQNYRKPLYMRGSM